ncbi:M48 family metallopeptidase [Zymomonas mobilis]|uniref:YgjP-like metallopeptidase domain-containing protein n=1 Tax=Zymomonas mobilis subsp. pomaceae (strain ATCC 29192 / DSM 22645 / JCM 10191 / CCUG 17912 / NBRC 13757 / NCIMB 11200 / NRRL B-4491 / Barker I) TaxID=579138 RepID=F8ETF1_ZYMMT|nr:SprT family zinc-dependent metalloprotease [Zymomonas mobilis]AEI37976.1 protein of unknown function DUF45 [Zymomonas mobilis subsp. pomaceae ATCC 29192]MDX5949344.1 SprT family zinc-dependent metalloprotease [Zymomonas mobilis subsp. pomaceae]GEB89924.1 zinc metalloprotease [Zymomonas mobilis subsp. pomaceae]
MTDIIIDGIPIGILRKNIKNIYIRILPPEGRVRISIPKRLKKIELLRVIKTRLDWIKRRLSRLKEQPPLLPIAVPRLCPGEIHYLWGERCTLDIVPCMGRPKILFQAPSLIQLHSKPEMSEEYRLRQLDAWYRLQLKQALPTLIEYWQPILGVQPEIWRIKKMKTVWGSCNIQAKRIWLNAELVKKPPQCLEYVIVHEMVHLLERYHNQRFKSLMDKFLPDWRERRLLLNKPLVYS